MKRAGFLERHRSLRLFLFLGLAVSCGQSEVIRKAEPVETSRLIEGFEKSAEWNALAADGITGRCGEAEGRSGKCLRIEFDFAGRTGYVVAAKDLAVALPANYRFTFFVKGRSSANTLEFKLIDKAGNTYIKRLENFVFPAEWKKVSIRKGDIAFGWGPGGPASIADVKRIEFGISTGSGGAGEVMLDELEIVDMPPPAPSILAGATATASSLQLEHKAGNVLDGKRETRWSSDFSDPQWLVIDLGREQEIAGTIIHWETAFGSAYDIELASGDAPPDANSDRWTKVFSTEEGDGGTDLLMFPRKSARYFRLRGRARGTAWGYSIFDIDLIPGSEAAIVTASSNGASSAHALDGNFSSTWASDDKPEQSLTIDLGAARELGGLVLHWKDSRIAKRTLSLSDDGESWNKVVSSERRGQGEDYLYFPAASARHVRIDVVADGGKLALAEISLKGPDEQLTPQKAFEVASLQAPPGAYPRWLGKEQEYWTILGVVDDDIESLLSEDGVIEPWHYSPSIAPFLRVSGKLVTAAGVERKQSLEEGYLPLPAVEWKGEGLRMTVDALAADPGGRSSTYLRYTVVNEGGETRDGEFYLALRPFQVNPPWMHGGLAKIESIEFDPRAAGMLQLNKRNFLFAPQPPDLYGATSMKSSSAPGDIVEDILAGAVSGSAAAFPEGYGSAALGYRFHLAAGESRSFHFIVPLHDKAHAIPEGRMSDAAAADLFSKKKEEMRKFWIGKLAGVRIELPDREFVETLKSNVAYILLNDDNFRLQPGSRNYESSWMRDGSVTATALLSMGLEKEVKRYLDWISRFVGEDGWVPFIVDNHDKIETHGWKEFDSQGQYIYSLLQYYLFTGDRGILAANKRKIIDDIKFMQARLAERRTKQYEGTEYFGIFPESASHEGYIDPPRHSYWDDFWGIRGLADAVRIFAILGDAPQKKIAEQEFDLLRTATYRSIDRVVAGKKIKFIPGCADLGDPDPTSTAEAIWPCNELDRLPHDTMLATFEMYWTSLSDRFRPEWQGGFTPYELRVANVYTMTGQRDRLHRMLTKFFEWKRPRPWNHWAEVVLSEERKAQYLGDMPHTWVGAEFVNGVRNMLVLEDGDALILGKGIAREWTRPGQAVRVTEMPTHFGRISYTVVTETDAVKIDVSGKLRGAGRTVFVMPPMEGPPAGITVNGKAMAPTADGEIVLASLPARIEITKGK